MEKTTVKNGQGSKTDAQKPKDTAKGVAALAVATAKAEVQPLTPLQERLRKLTDINKLTAKRKSLVDGLDKVNKFDEGLNGEDDLITLANDDGEELEISKPDAVKKVVELLKSDVSSALAQVDADLLAATI